ncbi:MAG: N-acetyltransferase [Alphaproteobacteria bacterium]|nr:N-acetyltransferase [Alphaproteobacteria bacterium]
MTSPTGFRIVAERDGDASAIEELLDRAFGADRRRKRSHSFRAGIESESSLRLVALDPAGGLAGTLRFWPILVAAPSSPLREALLLGPLAVEPALRGMGAGRALMHAGLKAAGAAGHALVLLVGEVAYYGQFGFVPAAPLGFDMPGERPERLLARALAPGAQGAGGTILRADAVAAA